MSSNPETLKSKIPHLPPNKLVEIALALQIIFDNFISVGRDSSPKKPLGRGKIKGRIVKIILFGSFARDQWVDDKISGYKSDYDLLIVVNPFIFHEDEYWLKVEDRLEEEWLVTKRIETPVELIIHSYDHVKEQLRLGRPFFLDIVRDGIPLYEDPNFPLNEMVEVPQDDMLKEAQKNYRKWFKLSLSSLETSKYLFNKALKTSDDEDRDIALRDSVFNAHQATERIYHCLLLTRTLYSPKLHNIRKLRALSEAVTASIVPAWPQDKRIYKRRFERLRRAYVEARYSDQYEITVDDLIWLFKRIEVLQNLVKEFCETTLKDKIFSAFPKNTKEIYSSARPKPTIDNQ